MAWESLALEPNQQQNTSLGSFSVIHVHDGDDPRGPKVRLCVAGEEEHRYNLYPGDTFPVAEGQWKLDRVVFHDDVRWTVFLSKVT
ncbi:DUF6406 domain-containing protein [Actinomadura fibrosa]|uniref:DUF6406 domain-containing protein n=1 Tax=Actinomadura fibrosa TaxID=111802 RepID=A0ABW2XYZ1_9ACTN|nr:DUF6406 domain-containing protein [Actinomadura fibrosa]